jgi:transcriptional regulator with XRE-family HTH domain
MYCTIQSGYATLLERIRTEGGEMSTKEERQEEARLALERQERPSRIFARRVKEIREDRRPRMTQADLARRLLEVQGMHTEDQAKRVEVARVMVSRTESGARAATVDDLVDFAQALEVPLEALLKGSGGIDALSDLEERMVNLLAQIRAASEPKPELRKEKKR